MKKHKFFKFSKKKFKIFLLLIILTCSLILYVGQVVNPIIFAYNKATVEHETISAVNNAITASLESVQYSDLIKISKNNNGNISMISSNTSNINKLNNLIVSNAQENLTSIGKDGFFVGLLTFTGISFLNNIGPKIKIETTPIGHAETQFKSVFTGQGINQTLHQIYINVQVNVAVLLPIHSFNIKSCSQVLICESVIVGEIPQTYLTGNLLGGKLNLVP